MKNRQWISLTSEKKEGIPSLKQVKSTDFKKILAQKLRGTQTGSTRITVELKGFWKDILSHKGVDYDVLKSLDSGLGQQEGFPALPQEGVFVAIPENAIFKELKIIDKKETELKGSFKILPAPKPVFEEEDLEYTPSKKAYESDDLYPGKIAEYLDTKYVAGEKVVHLMVYLAQYRAKSQKVYALNSVEIEIIYETSKDAIDEKKAKKKLHSHLKKLILDADSIPVPEVIRKKKSSGTDSAEKDSLPTDAITLQSPDNEADYVIITTEALQDCFAEFQSVKNYEYQTLLVTKTQILNEFPNPQEDVAIRNFLIYATTNWNVPPDYVVLGGNIDVIPTHVVNHQGTNIPSDHYYADLSGDVCPDIYVARFPASNVDDMNKICATASSYNLYCQEWRENELLTTYNRDDYNECKDQVAEIIGNHLNVIKEYDGQASKQDVIDTINAGVGFINYRGHGSNTGWSAGNGLTNADIPGLANGNKTPQVLSIACLNNNLDVPGYFGSTWMVNQKAISFLGASRPSYTTVNHSFDEYLWDGIINQELSKAGDIFNWATIKLYQNVPGENTLHNIYMYLLLGDPTANYKEGVMPETTVGYVLMMDSSGSMHDATSMVKIDAKAFVRESRPNDQFGINQFNNNASWVYPSSGNIATVSGSLAETAAAADAIESQIQANPSNYMTNLGQAFEFGNNMINQATTDTKAFVILSDGYWNVGPNPANILGSEPPIFVAGLGPCMKKSYFEPLLAKNPNSKFYHQPNAWEMMQIFNDIRALPVDVALTANQMDSYSGSDYKIIESVVSEDSDEAQISVVWSDNRYKYTSGSPSGYNINVQLIDPSGKTTSYQPQIVDEGYCIFNLSSVQPGTWRTLVQYSVPSQVYGTAGSFEFNSQVSLDVDAPVFHSSGKPLPFSVKMSDEGQGLDGLTVQAKIRKPELSVDNALSKYKRDLETVKPDENLLKQGASEEIAKLHSLRMSRIHQKDILPVLSEYQVLKPSGDGLYQGSVLNTLEAGPYVVDLMVKGTNPKTKKTFSRVKQFAVLVD